MKLPVKPLGHPAGIAAFSFQSFLLLHLLRTFSPPGVVSCPAWLIHPPSTVPFWMPCFTTGITANPHTGRTDYLISWLHLFADRSWAHGRAYSAVLQAQGVPLVIGRSRTSAEAFIRPRVPVLEGRACFATLPALIRRLWPQGSATLRLSSYFPPVAEACCSKTWGATMSELRLCMPTPRPSLLKCDCL